MAPYSSIEILDLRHFSSSSLRPLLEAESLLWMQRLHWDYRSSVRLLSQYLDSRILNGFAALRGGQVIGYAFCVFEETKAIIADVFTLPHSEDSASHHEDLAWGVEQRLLVHLIEMLQNSPLVDRIESQILLQPSGFHDSLFRSAAFEMYRRNYMVRALDGYWNEPRVNIPAHLELRGWRNEDLAPVGQLICDAYHDHPDSVVNDQYRTFSGSLRFVNNIVHHEGCGVFSAQASFVVVDCASHVHVAVALCSRIGTQCGHITQLCVHPDYRRLGLARTLLNMAGFRFLRQGLRDVSLTVTEANTLAIELYRSEGYTCAHSFDATVWQRSNAGSHHLRVTA